jgi:hypothetical protein
MRRVLGHQSSCGSSRGGAPLVRPMDSALVRKLAAREGVVGQRACEKRWGSGPGVAAT